MFELPPHTELLATKQLIQELVEALKKKFLHKEALPPQTLLIAIKQLLHVVDEATTKLEQIVALPPHSV